ncbi:hypothetical protein [Streptomyces lavendofoliae]|uniref:hypothetical protein n=1 Tax=Streptomyces lavendofoliae TaxID=67314 RepID=UPI003D936C3B
MGPTRQRRRCRPAPGPRRHGEDDKLRLVSNRLRELAGTDDYAYYADIAHFMAGLRLPDGSSARWLDGHKAVRARWQQLFQTRRAQIRNPG